MRETEVITPLMLQGRRGFPRDAVTLKSPDTPGFSVCLAKRGYARRRRSESKPVAASSSAASARPSRPSVGMGIVALAAAAVCGHVPYGPKHEYSTWRVEQL